MLTVLGQPQQVCQGISRRRCLQVAGAGLFGLSFPRILAAEAAAPPARARARSVIFLYLFGGPSQLETFDLKPDAPTGIRGPFKPIASRTPGLRICEHLPKLAEVSDKMCVVRSMTHQYNDHSSGGHYVQTGRPWHIPIGGGFNATPQDWPSIGSVLEYVERKSAVGASSEIPASFYLPNRLGHLETYSTLLDRPGQYGGWLGRAYDPLATDIRKRDDKDNPYYRDCTDEELDFRIKGLAADEALSLDRLQRRRSLLEQFDVERRRIDESGSVATYNEFQQRALALVSSQKTRDALDIRQEPAELRDRYGRHLFGQSTLLARRLVEAGSRFVTVCWDAPDGYSWDSHLHSNDVRDRLVPGLDQSLSALLVDLSERGLLDETLVVCLGEMGRTPQATDAWGRGHWSMAFPAVLAGAGIRGGTTYGATDKIAGEVVEGPTRPEDLAATVYWALGIDPELRVPDAQGRPTAMLEDPKPLTELFGA